MSHRSPSRIPEQAETSARDWLEHVLRERVPSSVLTDLEQRSVELRGGPDRDFFKAFALVPRLTGKTSLDLSEAERATAARTWCFLRSDVRVDEATRLWLVLAACADVDVLFRRLEALFVMADVGELVTLYRGLSLYPDGARWAGRAAEGVRSNMKAVYEAVALHNPYPSRWLADAAFNHLVVKALHVESPLAAIVGLSERMNPELVRMLRDYASERRSAKRSIDPALFQLLAPSDTKGTDV